MTSVDPESAAIRLTVGLADPAGFGLISHEIGSADEGAPTVRAERLSADRYLITRYIELDTRTEDPELGDRVAAPEVEFVQQGDDWFPVAARRGHYDGREHDANELAVALLRLVARDQAGEFVCGLVWPTSPGLGFRATARPIARAARSRLPS